MSSHISRATISMPLPVISAVRLVMVDTWQPRGRVRSSQRSAQYGQTILSKAGASAGTAQSLGTQAALWDVF